jgi:chaperonin GroES
MEIAAKMEAQGFQLIGERIAVIRDEAETRTKSGIYLSEAETLRPIRGTIVAVGDLAAQDGSFRVGDRITFEKYRGILHELPLFDGTKQEVEVFSSSSVYFIWRHDDPAQEQAELPLPSAGGGPTIQVDPVILRQFGVEPHVPDPGGLF